MASQLDAISWILPPVAMAVMSPRSLFHLPFLSSSPVCELTCYNEHTKPRGMLMLNATSNPPLSASLFPHVTYDCPI